jgi:tetraacyldisaccharide 4'-kinase
MPLIHNSYLHRVIANQQRGLAATALRTGLRIAEFFYASATRVRNKLFDLNVRRAHHLPVPVISIGNITAGGTGKTPFVRWLAAKLKQNGLHPAILMRGYHRSASGMSDEQSLLCELLVEQNIPVHAQPDRVAGGFHVLKTYPQTNIFILDDGFQHRRLARDVDLVLIDATDPLGHGHVHPRGLLREPPTGLIRATALVLTRCEQLNAMQLDEIEKKLRRFNSTAPIFRSRFLHNGLRSAATPVSAPPDIPLETLKSTRIFAVAAIANPIPFESTLQSLTNPGIPHLWFSDHHDYTTADLTELRRCAAESSASAIITTEKDWVKIRSVPSALDGTVRIWRLDLDLCFDADDEAKLWDLLTRRINRPQ